MRLGKTITLVAAMASNRAIGLDGRMPWHLPRELKHFKQTTMGKPIAMGRKTWESIGRALPGRQNIVVTRNRDFAAPGCDVAGSLEESIEIANGAEVMIIGGGTIYSHFLPHCDRLYLTEIDLSVEGDTRFPDYTQAGQWSESESAQFDPDERNPHAYRFITLERIA